MEPNPNGPAFSREGKRVGKTALAGRQEKDTDQLPLPDLLQETAKSPYKGSPGVRKKETLTGERLRGGGSSPAGG
jgi:hypothetical protein